MARVLVVDDSHASRELFAFILNHLGHEAVVAENGWVAVEKARLLKPDLVVMDILMPVMDGYSAARAMRDDPDLRDIPMLAASVSDAVTDETARAAGFDGFLRLPVAPDHFIATVQEHLAAWVPEAGGPVGSGEGKLRD